MKEKIKQIFILLFIKNTLKTIVSLIVLACLIVILAISVNKSNRRSSTQESTNVIHEGDLADILQKGKLKILIENSSASFFIYRGKKMGFEYEILKEFANEIGVELDIQIIDDLDNALEDLENGEGDILACNLTYTKERAKSIDFSIPLLRTKQVIVQRKPENWEKMNVKEYVSSILSDPSQLANKKVMVWKNSSYFQRLIHLQSEIGDTIFIQTSDGKIGEEEMIEMVSEGLIDYTVCDENVAKINKRFYNNIDVNLVVSFKQKIGFGLRKSSPLLKARLDNWLDKFMKRSAYKYIKHKYFNLASITNGNNKSYSSLSGGKISVFDHFFKSAQSKYDWDWRLIASVCFQESKFNPDIVSFGGAYSMMQFMPEIGPLYGVYPDSPPEIQIMGGAKKLKKDFDNWSQIPDKLQRQKFTVATYNSGKSHIEDARRLAEKYGLDPNVWDDNVEKMMFNLSKREYYKDPLVKSGAAKGALTCNYVKEIFSRYEMWKSVYK